MLLYFHQTLIIVVRSLYSPFLVTPGRLLMGSLGMESQSHPLK